MRTQCALCQPTASLNGEKRANRSTTLWIFRPCARQKMLVWPVKNPLVCSSVKKSARLIVREKSEHFHGGRPVLENWKTTIPHCRPRAWPNDAYSNTCILCGNAITQSHFVHTANAQYFFLNIFAQLGGSQQKKSVFARSARSPIAIGNSLAIINADCRATLHRINRNGYHGLYQ